MAALIKAFDRVLQVCEHLFLVLANACLIIMLTINVANIGQRALIDKGIHWVFAWTGVLFVWMTFLGFFVIYRRKKDITVDFVIDRLGVKGRNASRFLVNLIVMFLMAVMLAQAPKILSSQVGVIQMVGLQRYVLSLPLFISCALIFINFAIDTIRLFRGEGTTAPAAESE